MGGEGIQNEWPPQMSALCGIYRIESMTSCHELNCWTSVSERQIWRVSTSDDSRLSASTNFRLSTG